MRLLDGLKKCLAKPGRSCAVALLCFAIINTFGALPNAAANELFLYSEKELEAIEAHIKEHFGDYETVLHEIMSPDIHLDVVVIKPTPERNYYTLVTLGAGAYEMSVPQAWQPYFPTRAEHLVILPPNWDIENLDDPLNYWPIELLKGLARLPITNSTWLGVGHTMSADAENTPFAENTMLCSVLLTHPKAFGADCLTATLPGSEIVIFYQMVPIYEDELQYNHEQGFDAFEAHINSAIVSPLDINRPSVVPK
ncbi:MAG: suppressor of fused domain protein [Clostridia bacterium]|nr:suppressor of fused domain protein [Clostridia bacterium]